MKTALEPADRSDRLRRVIAQVLGISMNELTEYTSPGDLPAWDSVNHLNLIMAVENEFHVSIPADIALEMRSVRAIREFLAAQKERG